MKRMMIGLLLMMTVLAGMVNVQAAEAEITVQVHASETQLQVGDTVEYTVLATGSGVAAMQFQLQLPEGLRYVPNSGATPENLAKKLGVPAADWSEHAMMFTFYNDIGITFAPGTEILRFSCVAEKEGEWSVELYELLPFDEEFLDFEADLQVRKVLVTAAGSQITPTVPKETDPAIPDIGETQPPVSVAPETEPENTQPPSVPDATEPTRTEPQFSTDPTAGNEEVTSPTQEPTGPVSPEKHQRGWILPTVLVAVGACGVGIFFLMKKKDV